MRTRCIRPGALLVLCGLALGSACVPPVQAEPVLPRQAEESIRALFPEAVVTGVEAETDEGIELYVVRLARGPLTTDLEISAAGIVAEAETELLLEDVPDYVARAIREATKGGTLVLIEKHELHGQIEDGRLVALAAPKTVYEVKFVLDGRNRIVEVADTPALKLPQPAREAVQAAFPQARVRDVSSEQGAGLALYEVLLEQEGKTLAVAVSPEGTVASVETAVEAASLPPAVTAAIARIAGGAPVAGIEREEVRAVPRLVPLKRPRVTYEAEFTRDGRRYEVTVADDGSVVSVAEDDGEAEDDSG